MILRIAAEFMEKCYGLRILHEDFFIEIDKSKIPPDLLDRLSKWYNKYYKYTSMLREELEKVYDEISKLDKEGVELLKEFYELKIFDEIDKYQYFSIGQDKMLINW